MNITVTAERPEADKVVATITIPAAEVDSYIAQAYKDIAGRYKFQGFRKGRAPRPVIDGIVGREAVLADATNDLLNDAQPAILDELDIVPIERPDFGEGKLVEEGQDYTAECTISVAPTVELESFDEVEIDMPPAEATEAEIDMQIDQLVSYQITYADVEDDRGVEDGDIINVDIESKANAEELAGKNRTMAFAGANIPEELHDGILGMKKGETKEISWTDVEGEGDDETTTDRAIEVTLNSIKETVKPEIDDEFAKKNGFDTVEELRNAIKGEIEEEKETALPNLKQDRVVEAIGERVTTEEIPEAYKQQVFQELANEVLTSLQRQGMSLDMYLGARGIDSQDFLADLHEQADERARQGLALDALAKAKDFVATAEDVVAEFEKAGVEDVEAAIEQFRADGRISAIRESIRRTKAMNWLAETATVNEVDEAAKRREEAEAEDAE